MIVDQVSFLGANLMSLLSQRIGYNCFFLRVFEAILPRSVIGKCCPSKRPVHASCPISVWQAFFPSRPNTSGNACLSPAGY